MEERRADRQSPVKMDETTANGGRRESHDVVVFAFPRHGHMSPMLQFSKRLASRGMRVTFLTTSSAAQSLHVDLPPSNSNLDLQVISDVPESDDVAPTLEAHLQSFKATVSKTLADFIDGIRSRSENLLKLIVYDSIMPWVLDLARQRGLDAAPFFTQSSAVNHILYHVYRGSLGIPPPENTAVSLPSMPLLQAEDLPAFPDNKEVVLNFMASQFSNFQDAKWIFSNTFDQLECKVVNWMAHRWPIKTVGPTIPSAYLDGRLEDDKTYGLKLLKPDDGRRTMQWLDLKETASVVYISFGSLVILKEEQVKELTCFLRDTNLSFLWILRESEVEKVPHNFVQETSDRGVVVNWCYQLEVLSHKAVSCFVTHCGWNSTLEALSLGVPMVAIPQWVDQTTNAKFVADVWEVGVRVKMNDKRIAIKEELEASILQVVQGERRNEFKHNSIKWKKLAKEAMDEGGSSDKNIEEFVKEIASI